MARSAAGVYTALGAAAFIAALSLATTAAYPYPTVVSRAVRGLALAATMGSAAAWLATGHYAGLIEEALRSLDGLYAQRRRLLSHAERIAAVEHAAAALREAARLRRLQALWPIVAAGAGLPSLYYAVAVYASTRKAVARLRALNSILNARAWSAEAPGADTAAALLMATLGLGAPLAARWLTGLEKSLENLAAANTLTEEETNTMYKETDPTLQQPT